MGWPGHTRSVPSAGRAVPVLLCCLLVSVAGAVKTLPQKIASTPPTVIQPSPSLLINPTQVPALERMAVVWNHTLWNKSLGWTKPWACHNTSGVICDANGNVVNLILTGITSMNGGPCFTPGLPADKDGNAINCPVQILLDNPIPRSIKLLDTLTYLDLGGNIINGTIPDELFTITSLQHLDLSNNQFNASIPSNISLLTNLEFLDLAYTIQLKQLPPVGIGALRKLTFLNLYFAGIRGTIPASYGRLDKMVDLRLSGNSFNSSIPESLSALSSLQDLQLQQNFLSGTIPDWLGTFTSLTQLTLDKNNLTGTVPSNLGDLTDLAFLDLSYNPLTGELPASLAQLKNIPPPNNVLGNSFILVSNTNTTCPPPTKLKCTGPPPVNTTSQFCQWVCPEFCGACGKGQYVTSNSTGTDAGDQGIIATSSPPPSPPSSSPPKSPPPERPPPDSETQATPPPPPLGAVTLAPNLHLVGLLLLLVVLV